VPARSAEHILRLEQRAALHTIDVYYALLAAFAAKLSFFFVVVLLGTLPHICQ
jgi:hypothetical protein